MNRKPMSRRPSKALTRSRRDFQAIKPAVFARDNWRCAWCGGPAQAANHRTPRGMGGRTNDPAAHCPTKLVSMCNACHHRAETTDRALATDMGFFVPMGLTAAHCPVLYFDGWHKLTIAGDRIPVPFEDTEELRATR